MHPLIQSAIALAVTFASCNIDNSKRNDSGAQASAPGNEIKFNADSAYSYIKAQVSFGPRVPGTDSHRRCAEYIVGELVRH